MRRTISTPSSTLTGCHQTTPRDFGSTYTSKRVASSGIPSRRSWDHSRLRCRYEARAFLGSRLAFFVSCFLRRSRCQRPTLLLTIRLTLTCRSSLQVETIMFVHRHWIRGIWFLRGFEKACIVQLAMVPIGRASNLWLAAYLPLTCRLLAAYLPLTCRLLAVHTVALADVTRWIHAYRPCMRSSLPRVSSRLAATYTWSSGASCFMVAKCSPSASCGAR